jgi:capsule polysaccharide export protein KpsE/RkpR
MEIATETRSAPGEVGGEAEAAQAELIEAQTDLQQAETLVSQLLEKAKNGEKVTAAQLAEARAEVDLADMILQGRRLRIGEINEVARLKRVAELEAELASLAGDTSRETTEKTMRAALRSYVEAVHNRDEKRAELLNLAGNPALSPLPESIDVNGAQISFDGIVLRSTRYQTAISQAVAAAISEFYPRALIRLDTPND